MTDAGGFDAGWDEVYSAGGQLNRYPADGVVSFAHHLLSGRERPLTRVLEVGCGAGNNLWFFAREGFEVTGVDGSAHCLDYARARFAADGLSGTFFRMPFLDLGSLRGPFDLILDREALAHNTWEDLQRIMPVLAGLLHPQGHFLSFFFAHDHPDREYMAAHDGPTWKEPRAAVFGGAHWVTLPNGDELRTLFSPFELVDLYKRTLHSLLRKEPFTGNSEWIAVCRKK